MEQAQIDIYSMQQDIAKIDSSLTDISITLRESANVTFTFRVCSKDKESKFGDMVMVNKAHISCARVERGKLTIFFSGNDEALVLQDNDRHAPNFLMDSDDYIHAFLYWFDIDWEGA